MTLTLEADAFLESACRETGLDDLGVGGWRANLDALVDSLNHKAALSATGVELVWQWMARRVLDEMGVDGVHPAPARR
jgi:hypothetical protein